MITCTPLWEKMKQRRITIYALIKNDSFSRGTLDSLKHNRNITTATLNDLCRILSCRVEAVLVYIPDETEHIYFILKSQLHQRIGPALHQALTALGDRSVQITAQKDGSTHVIALQDVLYLERNLRKTKVITQQGVFLRRNHPKR